MEKGKNQMWYSSQKYKEKREREREDETQRVILLNKVRLCKDKAF